MQIHELKPHYTHKGKKRVGRGGKRGTYSGRGMKGQKSRAGAKIRPDVRDMIKKIPKKRGYRFASPHALPCIVNVRTLNVFFKDGDAVTPRTLREKSIISKSARPRQVKILGDGALMKKVKVSGCVLSKGARESIEKAGGSVE